MHNRKDCQLLSRRSSLLDWPHVGFVLFCLGVLGFDFSFFLIVCMLTVYFWRVRDATTFIGLHVSKIMQILFLPPS